MDKIELNSIRPNRMNGLILDNYFILATVINQMMIDHGSARTADPIRDMIKTTRDYEPDDEPHIKLKLVTRRIHQRKPFVNPISDTPILAETIFGAILVFWNPNSGKTPNCSCLCSGLQTPDQLQPQGVPEPRRPQFPVHITISLSSQSTHSQTQEEDASDVLGAHPRPDAKPSDPDQTRLSSARDRSRSSHLASVRRSLGGPGSTICKQKVTLILRT
ncbi:hypothetical protein F2Q69_00052119 [Brassica cretica]|uniref:Uncharacterized protein n=1 Tax=Brassica cretica TaxID=69181 RepID=A0A8S9N897_BRACR|nr:hypothetical protein F2Q69_00052119 [Brassica cretica]